MGKLWEPDDRYHQYRRSRNRSRSPLGLVKNNLKVKKWLWQTGASLLIFVLVWGIFQINSRPFQAVQGRIRDWFTEDYDIQPVIKLFSDIGLWGDTFERAAFEAVSKPEGPGPLTVPVSGQITATYGWIKGEDNNQVFIDGIAIAAQEGTPVRAALAGVVTRLANEEELGRVVEITADNGYTTTYAHCKEILVSLNDRVTAGQVIAKVGQTGNTSTPRLFFKIRDQYGTIDPGSLFIPEADKT